MHDQKEVVPEEVSETKREKSLDLVTVELVVAEYNTLRDEIMRRSDRQVQIMTITIIALGTLFAAGIQYKSAALILIYPLLAAALAAVWASDDRTIQATGAYIWKVIEEERTGLTFMGWEHFVADRPSLFRSVHRVAIRIFFVGSAIVAIIVGLSVSQQSQKAEAFQIAPYVPLNLTTDDLLLLIAIPSVLFALVVLATLPSGSSKWRASVTKNVMTQNTQK
jgi:hypothetical protein